MDEQGIDVEALSGVRREPCRFVASATVALQHPDLAAEQLEEGVKKYALRGAGIGGNVNGDADKTAILGGTAARLLGIKS